MRKTTATRGATTNISVLHGRRAASLMILVANGIPAKAGHSPYVGYVGIEVPLRSWKRAARLVGAL